MEDSTSRSLISLSRFLSLETETGAATEDDEDDEMKEHWTSLIEDEEYLRLLFDKDTPGNYIESRLDDWIKIGRLEAIQWIFDMRSNLQFQFHTAYLSVTYIDRFLSKLRFTPWTIRLLAIACLSLAAKMNERKDWANWNNRELSSDFQFQKGVTQRAELLVLNTLDWRMHSITPFHFIRYFISCFCKESSPQRRFISLISQIVCAATNGKYGYNQASVIYHSNGGYVDGHGSGFEQGVPGDEGQD
ncbi:hypothetical protein L1987_08783 [Smallanthus sonchifolius]|uniref:Uncharacterized protein n=1 Tax=Smallanthus sonchifolius TaxID=185202 RepID=A0ACB9JNI9_9ASTR|nr:hypothetical protein L1987_08783 [Smallanthus sonchifolius]